MNQIALIGQFIGPNRIKNFRDVKRKTFLGGNVLEVQFDNEIKKEYPVDILTTIVTKEAKDLTDLRTLMMTPVVTKILGILVDSELPIYDPSGANIQHILQTILPDQIQDKTREAYGKLYDKDYYEITLFDINKVLMKNGKQSKDKKENDKDGTSSK